MFGYRTHPTLASCLMRRALTFWLPCPRMHLQLDDCVYENTAM